MAKLAPVIMAGGGGTRLWPLSRQYYPKQFLPLVGETTLFQQAVQRLDGLANVVDPVIVGNEAHRFLLVEQLRQLGRRPLTILLEPVGRSTAPALMLAALWLGERERDPLILAMPADHVIRDRAAFQAAVQQGLSLAESGRLVTFGIVPSAPATGYGYIRRGAGQSVAQFVEKPDAETAKRYLQSGQYLWNSGIFLIRACLWIEELERHRPDIGRACRRAYQAGQRDGDFYRPDAQVFGSCPSESIDCAVMEKTDRAAVVPLDAGWSDVGDWSSLQAVSPQDVHGNVVQGDVLLQNTSSSLLLARHRLLTAVGLRDLIVVETADAVLIAHKDQAQDVKAIVQQLQQAGRAECEVHRKVYKPWGSYEVLDRGERFQVKRLTVNPGAALSLQKHQHRAEHWVVVRGSARVTRGDQVFVLKENESSYIPLGAVHRLENPGAVPLELIEVQSGDYLGEDDIVRLKDRYHRSSRE